MTIQEAATGATAQSEAPEPAAAVSAHAAAQSSVVPQDDFTDGTDSTFGDDAGSELAYGSVSSSIYNYRKENGRTYHAYSDGKYYVPNDEKEQDRMDMVYHAVLLMFDNKPFFAPVKKPQRIVDMGTGTGIWALDVGDQYPEAHVVGLDLSPIQPRWVAPNVEFRIDDIDLPWVFEKPIDLVHSRLCSGNAIRSWPKYLAEAYRCLAPGGWVEAQEFDLLPCSDDGSLKPDSPVVEWHNEFHKGMLAGGCNMRISAADIKRYMTDAGFINVQAVELKLPMSPWSKNKRDWEVGRYTMRSMIDDLSGLSMAVFTRLLGWDTTRLEVFLAEVRKAWNAQRSEGVHAYWPLFAVYGQKPGEKDSDSALGLELDDAEPEETAQPSVSVPVSASELPATPAPTPSLAPRPNVDGT